MGTGRRIVEKAEQNKGKHEFVKEKHAHKCWKARKLEIGV
jgi:hypothetical protein